MHQNSDQPFLLDTKTKVLTLEDYSEFVAFEEFAAFENNDIPPDHQPPHWTREEFKEYLERGEIVKAIYRKGELLAFYIFYPKKDELYTTEINDYPNTDRFWMEKVIKAQTHFYEETRQVRVDDVSALEAAILQDFVGTDLIRSQDQNPKRNLILFKKLKK